MIKRLTAFLGWKNPDLRASLLIGLGSFARIIYQPLGQFSLLLPQVGLIAMLVVSALYLLNRQEKKLRIDLGDKWVWVPLAVIVGIGVLRVPYVLLTGDTVWGLSNELLNAGLLLAMFALYVTSYNLGTKIFKIMPALVILASLGMVVYGVINPGHRTGGLISPTNYDMGSEFILFALLVSPVGKRWWLSAVAIVGLFFTGAEIAIFVVGVLALVILIRRDWSKRLLLPLGVLILTLLVCIPSGITQKLYSPFYNKISAIVQSVHADNTVGNVTVVNNMLTINATAQKALLNKATNYRWSEYWKLSPVKPLGYGYNTNYFYMPGDAETGNMTAVFAKEGITGGIPHNEVLIILEQLGPLALLAWLIATGRLLWKSGWTYAWIGFLALGLWDHEMWTTAGSYFFILAGVSSVAPITKDCIFRRTT